MTMRDPNSVEEPAEIAGLRVGEAIPVGIINNNAEFDYLSDLSNEALGLLAKGVNDSIYSNGTFGVEGSATSGSGSII